MVKRYNQWTEEEKNSFIKQQEKDFEIMKKMLSLYFDIQDESYWKAVAAEMLNVVKNCDTVMDDGEEKTVAHATWIHPEMSGRLNPEKEIFIRIEWKATVPDLDHGYWEKGMISLPLVAYMLNDRTTHRKVAEHFGYQPE